MTKYETRQATNSLLEKVDEGLLDARSVLRAALCYMSEYDVAEMARCEELLTAAELSGEDEVEDEEEEDGS